MIVIRIVTVPYGDAGFRGVDCGPLVGGLMPDILKMIEDVVNSQDIISRN